MKLFRLSMIAAAALASLSSAPAFATTYNLGTLPANVRVYTGGSLGPANSSDVFLFGVGVIGDLGSRIVNFSFVGLPGLYASYYKGNYGSGTLLKTIVPGNGNFISHVTPGNYYAVVGSSGGAGPYELSLITEGEPAPAPGPAGLLVLAAGGAAMAVRKRRAAKRAAA